MADDAYEYHDMVRRLTAMMVQQHTWNEEMVRLNQQQAEFNRDIKATLASVEITQARIETLLARMIERRDNGRDA